MAVAVLGVDRDRRLARSEPTVRVAIGMARVFARLAPPCSPYKLVPHRSTVRPRPPLARSAPGCAGNMSSATIMFVLASMMRPALAGATGCAMSFGPGMVAETMMLRNVA